MKVYKDAHMKIFSPYIISKNVLEKEFTTGISYFLGLIKKLLNILWYAKNNSVQNQGHKQHVIVNMLFQKVIYGNKVNKVINGNIVNMVFKIIEHLIYNIVYTLSHYFLSDLNQIGKERLDRQKLLYFCWACHNKLALEELWPLK